MKTLIALALLVVAVSAVPAKKSLAERVESSFNKWLLTEKKEVFYPDGYNAKKCDKKDCCIANSCAHGACRTEDNAPSELQVAASKFGYVCAGPMCGTDKNTAQYAGTFCDVPAKDACAECARKHGKYTICYTSTATTMGYICLKKDGKDYYALDRRVYDVMYGEGTAAQLEKIAQEEDEAEVQDKKSLTVLLKELISELDDQEN